MRTKTALGILFLLAGCGGQAEDHGENQSPLDESPSAQPPSDNANAEVPADQTNGDARPDAATSDSDVGHEDQLPPAGEGVHPGADDSNSLIDCDAIATDGACEPNPICGDDPDCAAGDDAVVCALYIEEPDGECKRDAEDPCIAQDPDCTNPAADDSDSLIDCSVTPKADDVCDPNDICGNDPDCNAPMGGDAPPVACFAPSQPNGVCDPSDPCGDPDCAADDKDSLIECPEEPETDGVCDASDICGDVDCADGSDGSGGGLVACLEYIEEPNGVCSRHETDPCLFQDPDCTSPEPGDSGLTRCMPNPPSDGVCDPSGECTPFDPDCEKREELPIESL